MPDGAIGIDIGGSFIKAGLVSTKGELLRKLSIKTRQDVNTIVQTVRHLVGQLELEAPQFDIQVKSVGIGSCGVVDSCSGVILQSVAIPGYDGTGLKALLEDHLAYPFVVENDVNAAAWAELQVRDSLEIADFLHVAVGTGIGCGVILERRIWHGSSYCAGEIGHITVDRNGPMCSCGNIGCLELYASTAGVINYAVEAIKGGRASIISQLVADDLQKVTIPIIAEAEKAGDEVATQAFANAGRNCGIGLTTLANLFDPQVISVGGGIVDASSTFFREAKRFVEKRALMPVRANLIIDLGRLGRAAGVIGAALLSLEEIGS